MKTWPPLGLPPGSVRALLALMVVGVLLFNFLANPTTVTDPVSGEVTETRALSTQDVFLIVGVLAAYGAMRRQQQDQQPSEDVIDTVIDRFMNKPILAKPGIDDGIFKSSPPITAAEA